jgi:DNA-binding NarL/FixJ family response regulator
MNHAKVKLNLFTSSPRNDKLNNMENLLKAIVIILFLYAIGKLSRKNELRVENAVQRLMSLFKLNKFTLRNDDVDIKIALNGFCEQYDISRREREVIELICAGKTNKEIEEELFISLQTVKDHTHRIYKKTGVKNRVQLNNLVREFDQQSD